MGLKCIKRIRVVSEGIAILAILALALLVRLPQLNFPSIGYHNMKENEYISMAQHMLKTGELTGRHVYFYNAFDENKEFNLYPQIPFVSYQILIGYKLFDASLWFPRLINILLMLGAFLCLYHIGGLLGLSKLLRLSALFLLAVMPLGIFFSRNLQAESGAFFFMCAGNLFGLRFIQTNKRSCLILFSLALAVTAAYKMAFLIGFLPIFLLVPFSKYASNRKAIAIELAFLIIPLSAYILYCYVTGQTSFSSTGGRVMLLRPFTAGYWRQYWPIIRHYLVNENFTLTYSLLSAGGILLAWVSLKEDHSLFARYIRAWSIMIIPYIAIFNDYINQHNYYQMPFLGLVVFACIYFIDVCIRITASILHTSRSREIFVAFFAAIFILSVSGIISAVRGHFQTIFPGGDVIGRYLGGVMKPDEKFFIYTTSQGYAPCVYAGKGCGWPGSIEDFRRIEGLEHIRYVVVYPMALFKTMPKDIKDYILGSYCIDSMGFIRTEEGLLPLSIVLKKGGRVDLDAFMRDHMSDAKLAAVYKTIGGNVTFL